MNGPRKLILAVMVVILAAGFSTASDIYFAQSAAGSNNGTSCANAYAYSDGSHGINVTGNWVAGNMLHLCGTITATAGSSNYLVAQGSGSAGNPITIRFESGAVLTAPYWSGAAINLNGANYVTVDGGTNGTIQATANGTGLANQQDSGIGVYVNGSSNVQVMNLTVSNIYVHACTLPIATCTDEGGQNTYGIEFVRGSNLQMGPNNTVHDMKWGLFVAYGNGNTNVQVLQNTVYHTDHGVVFGDAGSNDAATGSLAATCGAANGNMICQNTIYDGGNWDDAGDMNHHDGIHTWANNAPTSNYFVIISDNYVYGNWGYDMGSLIYVESEEQGIPVINNLLVSTYSPAAGTGILGVATGGGVGGTGIIIANNTIVGASSSNSQPGILVDSTTNPVIKNNVVTNTGTGVFIAQTGVTGTVANYHDYYGIGTANPFYCPGYPGATFGVWQSSCGFDANGNTGNPLLNATYHLTNSTSAAWQKGTNLYSLGITALNSDRSGVVRPASGAWDIGAYEDSSSNAPVPPTGLTAAVQ